MTELPKTPSFRLEGKRALIAGAGRGIGLAAALVTGTSLRVDGDWPVE